MEVFIQENLYVLDYNNNIVDVLYKSDDRNTPGYAFGIQIEEANTGYSNLSFSIPTSIIVDDVNISNPKLGNVSSLTKLRYERVMTYMGDDTIVIVEPVNNFEGDTAEITYKKGDIMEHYTMDYIVQPFEQNRQDLQINNNFTAIDYPRHVLSKKKAGLIIDDNTITTPDISIWNNKPIDVPGATKYIEWTNDLNVLVGRTSGLPLSWNPKSLAYPLTEAEIQTLLNTPSVWDYGVLATTFYWEVSDTARLEGTLYEEGNFIGLNIYNTLLDGYSQATAEYTPLLDKLAVNWLQIESPEVYLSPNNGLGYLKYLLNRTSWNVDTIKSSHFVGVDGTPFATIGDLETYVTTHSIELNNNSYSVVSSRVYKWKDTVWIDVTDESFGKRIDKSTGYIYNVDIEQEEIYLPDIAEQGITEYTDKTCALAINDSNCYNAITTLSTQLQLYPLFNCIKKTVALKARPGKDNGLGYQYGVNIKRDSVQMDGEKVITKLYVSGGADANGNSNINIGTANRATEADKVYPTSDGIFSWIDSPTGHYNIMCPVDYIISTEDQEYTPGYYYYEDNVYKYCVETSPLSFITLTPASAVKFTIDGVDYNVKDYKGTNITVDKWFNETKARVLEYSDGVVQEVDNFDPNSTAYLESRSPSGTNYILNFKYLYDKGYITRDQILDIYKQTIQLGILQKRYLTRYAQDYIKTNEAYLTAVNNEELNIINWQSAINAMMNIYYVNPAVPSAGTFYAFSDHPADSKSGLDWKTEYPAEDLDDLEDYDYYVRIADETTVYGYVKTPVFPDGNASAGDRRYTPKQKGFALQTIEQLSFDDFKYDWPALRSLTSSEITTILPTIANTDPSGTVSNYASYAAKFISYYKAAYAAHDAIITAAQNIEDIELIRIDYENQMNVIETYLQDNYGDFIIEGFYKNENQPYSNILFKEALTASDKFGYPDVTYNLNVIDSSGLFEYRNRTADTFNDLVHYLHSVGQIVPRAGDEVTIVDSALGMAGVPGMITTITRKLDNPIENSITIDTGFTDEEELVGNIIQATNTVLNNTDIYARTAILNKDGTINSESLTTSLSNPSTSIALVGSEGSSIFDSSGVLVSDSSDNSNQLKVSNGNILTSTDGGNNWNEIITPQGLNINHATIGTIDTTRVSIMDGSSKKVILNSNGLVVKNDPDRGYEIGGGWDNVKAFIGVDNTPGKNGQVFVDGMIRATQGSEIAGWSINDTKIYKENTTGGQESYTALSSDTSDYAIVAGTSSSPSDYKFTVTHDGDVTIGGGALVLDSNGIKITGDEDYILDANGIYTNLTFPGRSRYQDWTNIPSMASSAETRYADFGLAGQIINYTYDTHSSKGEYVPTYIVADIPENFVIVDAQIRIRHYPKYIVEYDSVPGENIATWGTSRSVKIYKTDYLTSPIFSMQKNPAGPSGQVSPPPYNMGNKKLVNGYTWKETGTNSWTASTPSGDPESMDWGSIVADMEQANTVGLKEATVDGQPVFNDGLNCFLILPTANIPYYGPAYGKDPVGSGIFHEKWGLEEAPGGGCYYAGSWVFVQNHSCFQSTAAADSIMTSIGQAKVANKTFCLVGNPADFASTWEYTGDDADLIPYIWDGSSWVDRSANKVTTYDYYSPQQLRGIPAGTNSLGLSVDTSSHWVYYADEEQMASWFEETVDGVQTTSPILDPMTWTAARCGMIDATLTIYGYFKPIPIA